MPGVRPAAAQGNYENHAPYLALAHGCKSSVGLAMLSKCDIRIFPTSPLG
jgi:hypothetical protein